MADKLDNYLIKTYGIKGAHNMKTEHPRQKDLLNAIIIKELNRTYKYSDAVGTRILSIM